MLTWPLLVLDRSLPRRSEETAAARATGCTGRGCYCSCAHRVRRSTLGCLLPSLRIRLVSLPVSALSFSPVWKSNLTLKKEHPQRRDYGSSVYSSILLRVSDLYDAVSFTWGGSRLNLARFLFIFLPPLPLLPLGLRERPDLTVNFPPTHPTPPHCVLHRSYSL